VAFYIDTEPGAAEDLLVALAERLPVGRLGRPLVVTSSQVLTADAAMYTLEPDGSATRMLELNDAGLVEIVRYRTGQEIDRTVMQRDDGDDELVTR
jgi:hypothetical protein